MPKGGARINSGPPPDPNALRRDRPSDAAGWTTLPSVVRDPAPAFPLLDAIDRELELWGSLWCLPQAAMWARQSAALEVAMYVRLLVVAEEGKTTAAAEARQWSDRLGLNPAAMARLRWKIADDELADRRPASSAASAGVRDRLGAVSGG